MGRLVNWYVFQRIVVLTVVRTASMYLSSLTFVKNKDRSFRCAQTASISLNSVELSEFTSFNFQRIVVLTVVRTASMYLSSLTFVKNKDRSFRCAQTASISLNSVELSEFTSFNFQRIVVLTVVRTASMYLSSLTFAKVRREKGAL